jgi:cell division protease FtsH
VAAYLQEQADDPVQVTSSRAGPAGGVTWMSGNDDQFLPRRKAHAQLVTALAGRAAEEILLDGEFTQGAAGDLQSATELATSMATRYGMTRLVLPGSSRGSALPGCQRCRGGAARRGAHSGHQVLGQHKAFLGVVAAELLAEETLTLADVHQIATRLGISPATPTCPRPQLPGQVRAGKPVICMEVPSACRRGCC